MEKIELGKVYVSETDTSAGHNVRFWYGLAGNMVGELEPVAEKVDDITWKVTPSNYFMSGITWKVVYTKTLGLHFGDNNNKKSIGLTKIVPYDELKEYFNVWDASKLK